MAVPDSSVDIASFSVSNRTAVSLSKPVAIDSIVFNPGANAYTITYDSSLSFDGLGVVNNSGTTQNFFIGPIANPGLTFFNNSASAGSLTVFTNYGSINFNDTSTAGSASFINNAPSRQASGGSTNFFSSSTAAKAKFALEGGTTANGGTATFNDNSSAANALFTVGGVNGQGAGGGNLYFFGSSLAGDASVTVQGNQFPNSDPLRGFVAFFQDSSAANASLTAKGSSVAGALGGLIEFAGSSTAANASLTANGGSNGGLGGEIEFLEYSSGGFSQVHLLGNAKLELSANNTGYVTLGSLEGSGEVFLGSNLLSIQGNTRTTQFAGNIHDGGIGGGTGGSFVHNSSGTLILSGTSDYTGNTYVNGGTVLVNNTRGSGTGTGIVHVNDDSTLGGSGRIAGEVVIGAPFGPAAHLSPGASNDTIGILTTESLLTFLNGTLEIDINSTTGTADQMIANGVDIVPIKFLADTALLSLTDIGNGVLAPGTSFTIINNTAIAPINGRFDNLADGGILSEGRNTFIADYEGGDGNDLTLRVVGRSVPDSGTTRRLMVLGLISVFTVRLFAIRRPCDSPPR